MSSIDYLNLCRLCLVKESAFVPIFDGEGDGRQISLKIAACLPVKVTRDDKLPKKICNECVQKIELFYQFCNTTTNAEKQLLEWIGGVDLNDKQTYVSAVINQDQSSNNRLDGNVMQQTNEQHQNNIDMNMMESIGLEMPMMIQQNQTQMTINYTNNTNAQSMQSNTVAQQQNNSKNMEESDDDHCGGDDDMGQNEELSVKEEIQDSNRTIEPTFVSVSSPCEEAGPSGLQQKSGDIPDGQFLAGQSTDGDPKSGLYIKRKEIEAGNSRGLFTFDQSSVVMKKWQILEFDGKPYYVFVPEHDKPIDTNNIPSENDSDNQTDNDHDGGDDNDDDDDESINDYNYNEFDNYDDDEIDEIQDVKPILLKGEVYDGENSADASSSGELYQVNFEGNLITLQKINNNNNENDDDNDTKDIKKPIKVDETIIPKIDNGSQYNSIDEDDQYELIENNNDEEESQNEEIDDIEDGNDADYYDEDYQLTQEEDIEQYQEKNINESDLLEYISVEEQENDNEEDVDDVDSINNEIKNNKLAKLQDNKRLRHRKILKHLKCKLCDDTFESKIAFRKHVAWTHKKKVYIQDNGTFICSVCDFRTSKKSLFAAHIERKHETGPGRRGQNLEFPCPICNFICRSKHSLQSHHIRKHTDTFQHQCNHCDKKFKVKGDLTNHIRFHHKEKPVKCNVCGKICQNTGSLYVHQKWAHYKPKYECRICKRRMVTQKNLDQHMVSQHEKREKISCELCSKTFTKKDSYKRHMAVHTGSKPHSCPVCKKKFARQSQLRQHVLIHTGQRAFGCDLCPKTFTQKPGLICHRKTHPGPHPPLPVMPIADIVEKFISTQMLEQNKETFEENEEEEEEEDDVENLEEEEEEEEQEGEGGEGGDGDDEGEEQLEEARIKK